MEELTKIEVLIEHKRKNEMNEDKETNQLEELAQEIEKLKTEVEKKREEMKKSEIMLEDFDNEFMTLQEEETYMNQYYEESNKKNN